MFLGLFEPFRMDLTRRKGSLHFKYHLVCQFVNATILFHLEFSLSSLSIKRESPLRPSHNDQKYVAHDEKSKVFIFRPEIERAYAKHRNVMGLFFFK